jgi:hypothetical protein
MSSDQSSEDLYANTQARINTVVGEYSEDWRAIKLAKRAWWEDCNYETLKITQPFEVWAEDRYGIRITKNLESMGYNPKFEIVDESKYIIFLLKYK